MNVRLEKYTSNRNSGINHPAEITANRLEFSLTIRKRARRLVVSYFPLVNRRRVFSFLARKRFARYEGSAVTDQTIGRWVCRKSEASNQRAPKRLVQ